MIRIDNELFQIANLNAATNQLTVTRAMRDNFLNVPTVQAAHAIGAEVWANRVTCLVSARTTPTASMLGPEEREDTAIVDGQYFTTLFNSSFDQFGLATFSSTANPRGPSAMSALTFNYTNVRSAMAAIAYPDGGTNTAHGIAAGRLVLDGAGSRAGAVRIMVLLTDGRANAYCGSPYNAANYNSATNCPSQGGGADGNATAVTAAQSEATRLAKDQNTIIYVIGLGNLVDDAFLTNIATIGHGLYFKSPTTADLQAAFTSVAQQAHISLTR